MILSKGVEYEKKLELAQEKITKKGNKRASKFNLSHKLTEIRVVDKVLMNRIKRIE